MPLLALSFPIQPGQTDRWKQFVKELKGPRFKEFQTSRAKLGVRERTFLQKSPTGDVVIVTLRGKDPAGAFAKMAKGKDAFSRWFTAEVGAIHGIDLKAPPPGLPELLVDSNG